MIQPVTFLLFALHTSAFAAQIPVPPAAITGAEVARDLTVLMADSLRQRPTPSRALEQAAQYVAAEFQRLGLTPGAQDISGTSSWFQRYPLPGQQRVDPVNSTLALLVDSMWNGDSGIEERLMYDKELSLADAVYFTPEVGPQQVAPRGRNVFGAISVRSLAKPLVVVAGPHTPASLAALKDTLRTRVALYVAAPGADTALQGELIRTLYRLSLGVIVVSWLDSTDFARVRTAQPPSTLVDDYLQDAMGPHYWKWAITVRGSALSAFARAAGLDLAALRTTPTPTLRVLPSGVGVWLRPVGRPAGTAMTTAPNVVGVLDAGGQDRLKPHILVVAHLDTPAADEMASEHSDSASAIAAENSAGVAALLATARALRQPGVQVARPVTFLVTTGSTRALWGANYFIHSVRREEQLLALNLALGHATDDSLWIDGLDEVELPAQPTWVAAQHPELGLQVAAGGTVVSAISDHFPFVQAALPSLTFRTAADAPADTRADPHAIGHGIPAAVSDRVAAVASFVSYLTQTLAAADQRPRWSAEARRRLRDVLPMYVDRAPTP